MHSVSLPRPPADKEPELRITVVIGAALIVQTALGLIWTGAASERLSQLERGARVNAALLERTARLEEQTRFMAESLTRIEAKLDRVSAEEGT